jgi:20S proteasome alpha/beta subunit
LEKNYKEDQSRDDTIRLTIKSLLEVVQTGAKNIEITVMESYGKTTVSPGLFRSDARASNSYSFATSPRALHIYRS